MFKVFVALHFLFFDCLQLTRDTSIS